MSEIINFNSSGVIPDKKLLGGKGASLVEMTQLKMPVPPGFILTTDIWREYDKSGNLSNPLKEEILAHVTDLEHLTGRTFAKGDKPMLLSVRSGSPYSMPGMMDTIINVGVTEELIPPLSIYLGSEVVTRDIQKRSLRSFGSSVFGVHAGEFDNLSANSSISDFEDLIFNLSGNTVPIDPTEQLFQSVEAVFRSWYNPGAVAYRRLNGIPDDLGTAATIQLMVFGNLKDSGTGVLFTRDTTSGEDKIVGDYLNNAQGEDIVRGSDGRKTLTIDEFIKANPDLGEQLIGYAKNLEHRHQHVQDIEFTVEKGVLWLLQSRKAKRTPIANVWFAHDFYREGLITLEDALQRIKPSDIEHISLARFDSDEEQAAQKFSVGSTASPGVAVGQLSLTPADISRFASEGKKTIYVCNHIDPNDLGTLMNVAGVVTTKGSASSHMALILRSAGIPGIVGASRIQLEKNSMQSNGTTTRSGEMISINASQGCIYVGEIGISPDLNIPAAIQKFIDERQRLLTKSSWSAGIYHQEGAPVIADLVQTVKNLKESTQEQWNSEKARIIALFDKFFDSDTMIKNRLVSPADISGLRAALIDVIQRGYVNYARTCHSPVKLAGAPWSDGPNTIEDVEKFLTDSSYPGKYGGYPKWVEDGTLDAIIVGDDFKGKLDPKLADKHLVCTLSCVNGMTSQLVINVNFGTAQLRSLERVNGSDLATIKINLDSENKYSLGDRTIQVGIKHLDDDRISKLSDALNGKTISETDEPLERITRHLKKQLLIQNKDYSLTKDELKEIVYELMTRDGLPADVSHWVIDRKYLSLLDQIYEVVTQKWWRQPVYLPFIMAALDEVTGLSVLECQGRFEDDKLEWFKIYGAKGSEERDNLTNWKNTH